VGAGTTGKLSGLSWPSGKGLCATVLVPDNGNYTTGLKVGRSAYRIKAGKFRDGSSGGGVFQGGRLIGVASHGRDDKVLLACEPKQLDTFLRAAQTAVKVSLMSGAPPAPRGSLEPSGSLLEGPLKGDRDRAAAIAAIRQFLVDFKPPVPADAKPDPQQAQEIRDIRTAMARLESRLGDLEKIESRLRDLEARSKQMPNFRVELVIRLKPTPSIVKVRER
jgi:hypothetical protein